MEIIAPLLLAAMVGLVILIVLTARRQRAAGRKYFVGAARTANLAYLQEDDGTAEALAQGFDQNEFARLLLEAVGTPTLSNSDTHSIEGIGYVATEFEREITDVPGLIVELQTARFRPWTAPGWVATGMTPMKPPNRP